MDSKTGMFIKKDVRLGCYFEEYPRVICLFLYGSLKLAGLMEMGNDDVTFQPRPRGFSPLAKFQGLHRV